MKIKDLTINPRAINDGAWVTVARDETGEVAFKVLGTRSDVFRRAEAQASVSLPRHERELLRAQDPGAVLRFEARRAKLKGQYCVLDWRGIENDAGAPVAFTRELAVTFMTDDRYYPLRAMIEQAIDAVDAGIEDTRETAEKNFANT